MNCSIVFYSARKTSLCEKALKKCIAASGLTLSSAVFATKKDALGDALIQAFAHSGAVFTVGGLEFEDNRSIRDIISQAASGSEPSVCRRIKNDSGDDGYFIRAGGQVLVMLPDEPEQIEAMTHGALALVLKRL